MADDEFRYGHTRYGFEWGPSKVSRIASTPTAGVILEVESVSRFVQIRVTPSGLIRVGKVVKKSKPRATTEQKEAAAAMHRDMYGLDGNG